MYQPATCGILALERFFPIYSLTVQQGKRLAEDKVLQGKIKHGIVFDDKNRYDDSVRQIEKTHRSRCRAVILRQFNLAFCH